MVSLAVQLLLVTAVLHRFAALPTALAINLMAVAFSLAALAGLIAVAALTQIWRHGSAGTSAAARALLLGCLLLLVPAYYLPAVLRGNVAADASTDIAEPPAFDALGKARISAGINPAATPSGNAGSEVTLEPIVTPRAPGDVFDLTNELIRQLDLNIVAEQAPGFGAADGSIEATDRSLVLGLIDDISIRVGARDGTTRVDVRSAARYPRLDLGRNAERVQMIVRKLQASIDASVPTEPVLAGDAVDQAAIAIKPPDGTAGAATVLRRKRRLPFPPGAPGGPAQTTVRH